jgi:RNA polymerase sigma-70 factor (ECF subfamily)
MLLHDARRPARVSPSGSLVTLEEQDRSLWNATEITAGSTLLETALRLGSPGPYQVQAAIAACHATAPTAAETDWPQIAALYGELRKYVPSPVVALNQAVAVAMAHGPLAGLEMVDSLDGLAGYHLLPATRADLLRRLGRHAEAAAEYRAALSLVTSEVERRYLADRLTEVSI